MTALAAPADRAPVEGTPPERWPVRLTAAATLVCAALVLFDIGDKSLWFDEGFSIGIVDRPVGDVLWRLYHWEMNQSPFYVLLAGWWRVGGTEAFLRLLPAVPAVASVPALFLLGRRLFDARVGAVAAALLAVHPFSVQWGQQLRAYSLVMFLVVVATLCLLRALDRPADTGRALVYAVAATVAAYAHFYALLVVAAHAVWFLASVRPLPRRPLLAAAGTMAVLLSPLAWYFLTRQSDPLDWVEPQATSALSSTVAALSGNRWGVLPYGLAVAAGAVATLAVVLPGRGAARWGTTLPVVWVALPLAVLLASTLTVKPLLEPRFTIVVLPAFVLLAALGLCRIPRRAAAAVAAAVVVTSLVGVRAWYVVPGQEDWRAAAAAVAAGSGPDAAVAVEPWGAIFAFRYYEDRPGGGQRQRVQPEADDPPAGPELVEVVRESLDGDRPPLDPGYLAWRDRHYELVRQEHVRRIGISFYERR